MAEAAIRVLLGGSKAIWVLGIVLAINASLSDEYIGAGACLAASALAARFD